MVKPRRSQSPKILDNSNIRKSHHFFAKRLDGSMMHLSFYTKIEAEIFLLENKEIYKLDESFGVIDAGEDEVSKFFSKKNAGGKYRKIKKENKRDKESVVIDADYADL